MEALKVKAILNETVIAKPCVKMTVKAFIVAKDGSTAVGSNSIRNKVDTCPRVERNCPTGEGYELCKSVCDQGEHAEVSAIQNAQSQGIDLTDATLYITGHTYFCDNCIAAMTAAGIKTAHCFDSGLNLSLQEA